MEFQSFPKIPRLNRDIVITEKIDGTNAAILIEEVSDFSYYGLLIGDPGTVQIDGDTLYLVQAQSRKRLITPGGATDNSGFAGWVHENAVELVRLLGPGRHFGEWWGQGIQRGYGMTHKVFSLFNPTFHFGDPATSGPNGGPSGLLHNEVRTVPVLYEGIFSQRAINTVVGQLADQGSLAAPGFKEAEGVIIFHTASRGLFKVTCKDDEKPKGFSE